jgi:hypothetical protein
VRRLAEREETPTLFGKALVDVGNAFGASALAAGPAPVRTVVVLAPAGADPTAGGQVSWMHLGARAADAARLGAALGAIPGVVVEEETEGGGQRRWRLRVEHALGPTEALGDVVEDDAVLYSERAWSGAPDFDAAPAAAPLKRREAAVLLTRELLNRRRGSRFLAGRPDGVTGLVLEVAHALREAQCWRVQVGRFAETADLVERLTGRSGV